MLTLLSPVATGAVASLPAANATEQILKRQMEARHVAAAPEVAMSGTALSSMVDAALQADPAYGLISALSGHEITNAYNQTANLLNMVYGSRDAAGPAVQATA